jgi:hypothetical protein
VRVIVVHEDGDRESRVAELFASIDIAVNTGSMRYQGVGVELRHESEIAEGIEPR